MQWCPYCNKVYDESEYSHCPWCKNMFSKMRITFKSKRHTKSKRK